MTRKFILAENIEDDGYNCYFPSEKQKVFGSLVDYDEYEIYISKEFEISDILKELNVYMDFLSSCKKEVIEYFESKTGDKLPEEWFNTIEVYNASITFNSADDFGATVVFSEGELDDCIFELDFEKFEITDDRFEG